VRFIIDAQLPRSLSVFFNNRGHDSVHTLELPNGNNTRDLEISILANDEEIIVITKDIDFLESFLVKSEPRKLIMVKTGNISNRHLIKIFEDNLELLLKMISRSNLIEVSSTEIAEHG